MGKLARRRAEERQNIPVEPPPPSSPVSNILEAADGYFANRYSEERILKISSESLSDLPVLTRF